jgi:hypothetical protein
MRKIALAKVDSDPFDRIQRGDKTPKAHLPRRRRPHKALRPVHPPEIKLEIVDDLDMFENRCQSALKNDPGSALNFDPARDDGSGAMVMRFDGSGPVLEVPALVAGLDDVTVMG